MLFCWRWILDVHTAVEASGLYKERRRLLRRERDEVRCVVVPYAAAMGETSSWERDGTLISGCVFASWSSNSSGVGFFVC